MRCVVCKKEAEIKILAPFCSQCFITHYQRRVERVIKRWQLISKNERILVCVSGGKDSLSCAEVLYQLKDRFQFELAVLHLDVNFSRCANERTKKLLKNFVRKGTFLFILLLLRSISTSKKLKKFLKFPQDLGVAPADF
jgi:tRNA-5-methyluridine54 2-sulfurtransferase